MPAIRRRAINGVDDLIDRTAAAALQPRVLVPGPVRGVDLRIAFSDLVIDSAVNSFPVATRGRTHPGLVALLFAFDTPAWGHVNGDALGKSIVYVCGPGTDVAVGIPAGIRVATVAIDVDALPGHHDRLARSAGRSVRTEAWHDLVATISLLERRLRAGGSLAMSPREIDGAHRRLVGASNAAIESEPDDATATRRARTNSFAITEACETYAARWRFQGLTISNLCDAAGVSERRLRYAFQDCYGMSPTAFLRGCALHEVRATLSAAGEGVTVTEAATDLGFWHLGRFSGQYRALFGESPSDTLVRTAATATTRAG